MEIKEGIEKMIKEKEVIVKYAVYQWRQTKSVINKKYFEKTKAKSEYCIKN